MKYRTIGIGLAALLLAAATGCVDPKDRRPGLRLSGEVVREVITDWSFSDKFVRVDVPFGVSYDADPHEVVRIAVESASSV